MTMIHDDELAKLIRTKAVDPDKALQLLKDDRVLVYGQKDLSDSSDWADAEDHGMKTGIYHALHSVKAGDRSDEFAQEIVRLRSAGLTMETLWEES